MPGHPGPCIQTSCGTFPRQIYASPVANHPSRGRTMKLPTKTSLWLGVLGTSACFVTEVPFDFKSQTDANTDIKGVGNDVSAGVDVVSDVGLEQGTYIDAIPVLDTPADRRDVVADASDVLEGGCTRNRILCDSRCLAIDNENCGACGRRCTPTQNAETWCMGRPIACVHRRTDGMCFSIDGSLGRCTRLVCVGGFEDCDHNEENGCEAYTVTDSNCGSCGRQCAPGETCARSPASGEVSCVSCETAARTRCGDMCVDLLTDNANCGQCGRACNQCDCQTCRGGVCTGFGVGCC